jgi:hypothetical protein
MKSANKESWTRRGYCLSTRATRRLYRLAVALYHGRGDKRQSELMERFIWAAKVEDGHLAFDAGLDYPHGNDVELPEQFEEVATE